MAATQVARNSSFNGFDEFLNLPASPALTPRLPPAKLAQQQTPTPFVHLPSTNTVPASPAASMGAIHSAFNMRKVGLDENQPPPPPGSSPEALFRYYLAAELRKAGTRPDEALLDRYVKNHFESLFKNKQPPNSNATATAMRAVAGPSVSIKPAAPTSVAEPISLRRLPVPRKTPATAPATATAAPVASTSSQPALVATVDACSPPELQVSESPSLSAKSLSSLPTLPALEPVDENAEFDFATKDSFADLTDPVMDAFDFSGVSGIDSQVLSASAFRREPQESVSIDPHMMQMDTASSFDLLGKGAFAHNAVAPSQQGDVTAMWEDGLSDLDDEDSKDNLTTMLQLLQQGQQPEIPSSSFAMFRPGTVDGDGDGDDSRESTPAAGHSSSGGFVSRASAFPKDVKPDPEEYKKLSSKEKRQLRNKISARNFRTRRKEYIGHLEEQVADRDSIIEGLRQQLSQVAMEKTSLQEEVRILRSKTISQTDVGKILEALQKNLPLVTTTPAMPAPASVVSSGHVGPSSATVAADYSAMAPLTPSAFLDFADSSRPATPTGTAPFGSGAVAGSPRASSPRPSLLRRSSPSLIAQPNTKKDVGPQSSFWGGIGGGANGQSFTSVC